MHPKVLLCAEIGLELCAVFSLMCGTFLTLCAAPLSYVRSLTGYVHIQKIFAVLQTTCVHACVAPKRLNSYLTYVRWLCAMSEDSWRAERSPMWIRRRRCTVVKCQAFSDITTMYCLWRVGGLRRFIARTLWRVGGLPGFTARTL